jgi:hypothetical protein
MWETSRVHRTIQPLVLQELSEICLMSSVLGHCYIALFLITYSIENLFDHLNYLRARLRSRSWRIRSSLSRRRSLNVDALGGGGEGGGGGRVAGELVGVVAGALVGGGDGGGSVVALAER